MFFYFTVIKIYLYFGFAHFMFLVLDLDLSFYHFLKRFCAYNNLSRLPLGLRLFLSLIKFGSLDLSVDYPFSSNCDKFFKKLWITHFLEEQLRLWITHLLSKSDLTCSYSHVYVKKMTIMSIEEVGESTLLHRQF